MDIISKEEYIEILKEKTTLNKQSKTGFHSVMGRYVTPKIEFKEQKFNKGDIIHTIAYHYVEDENGNDINQNIIFVNTNIITGEYKVIDNDYNDGYRCITIKDVFSPAGTTAHIGKKVIFENYEIRKR